MGKTNYFEIFKKAWQITWDHKYLWWLGLFAGSETALNMSFPGNFQKEAERDGWSEKIASFAQAHWQLIIGMVILIVILAIILGLLKILAFSGLIRSLFEIRNGKKESFREGLEKGKKFFTRILAIRILLAFAVLALIIVLALPVVFLFVLKSFILGGITALLAFIILIPAMISFSFIAHYGSLYVLTSDISVRSALEQGYKLFMKNIWPSLLMSLLFIPLNILVGLSLIIPIIAIAVVFGILGIIFYQLFSTAGILIVLLPAGFLFLALLLFIRSVLSVFTNSAWLLFFQSIAAVKKEEVEISEEIVIDKAIPEKA